jgi:hypothetical protein
LEAASYRVLRAQRQYESIDPENRLVARELERRWNVALQEKQAIELRIAEESGAGAPSNVGTLEEFLTLAHDLESVWSDARTDERAKKRLLRARSLDVNAAPSCGPAAMRLSQRTTRRKNGIPGVLTKDCVLFSSWISVPGCYSAPA